VYLSQVDSFSDLLYQLGSSLDDTWLLFFASHNNLSIVLVMVDIQKLLDMHFTCFGFVVAIGESSI